MSTGSSVSLPPNVPARDPPTGTDRQIQSYLKNNEESHGLFSQVSPYQVLKYVFMEKEFYFT